MKSKTEVTQKPKTARDFFRSCSFWRPVIGIVLGGIAGYLYYHFVGCSSGTCPITSHPLSSIAVGSLMGYLITGIFEKRKDN
jgi:cobalamin synthase